MFGVTELIDILNKPALINWANKIGLKGIDIKNYKKEVTTKGTNKHEDLENYIKNGVEFIGFEKFKESIKSFKVIGCEVEIKNDYIIGRADLILKKDNLTYIIDFKSSKNIYLSTKLQLSTYKEIYDADKVAVMDLDNFNMKVLDIDTTQYYNLIKRLYQIKLLLIKLNERL